MKIQRLIVAFVAIFLTVVSGNLWKKITNGASHIGGQISDNLSVLGGDIERGVNHYAQKVNEEYNERVEPQVKSWFTRENTVYLNSPAELEPRAINETTCIGFPQDSSIELDCLFEGVTVNCSAPAQVGTMVNMGCCNGYKPTHDHGYRRIECKANHVWNKALWTCLPDCGRQNSVGGQHFIANGQDVCVGEFTWHIGIYRLNDSQQYSQICGGSLITPSFVVTAAHCFWDFVAKKIMPKELFSIAAGKFDISWYVDDPEVQRRNLSEIHMAPRFAGERHFLAYDIALLRLDRDIVLTLLVNVICMDFSNSLEAQHLIPGRNGSIAGWGITEHNVPSEVLKSVGLPYFTVETCETLVETKFLKFLTHDKYCAGYRNQGTSICPGDSGGGLAFPQQTVDGKRFYLRGIASVGQRPRANSGLKCQSNEVAAFTKVSLYLGWIRNVVLGTE